jgi:5,5'-dehydrodivanillate O-demethylase
MGLPPAMTVARHVKIDFDVFEYGIYKRRLLEGEPEDCDDWQIGHPVLFPNILAVGDSIEPSFQVRIPIDDTHTTHYRYLGQPPKGDAGRLPVPRVVPVRLIEDDGSIVANTVLKQDMLAWVGQGPISDRTREHLATSDRGVALYHQMLLDNVERVQRGGDPMGVIRDDAINTPSIAIKRETTPRTAFAIAAGVI